MKTALILLTLLTTVRLLSAAPEPNSEAKSLMNDIARHAREIRELTFPRPSGYDPDLSDISDSTRYFNRDVEALSHIDPSLVESSIEFYGVKFNELIKNAKATIEKNKGATEKSSKDIIPADALINANMAIKTGQRGIESLSGQGDEAMKEAVEYLEIYRDFKKKAEAIDLRSITKRKEEFGIIEDKLVAPVTAYLERIAAVKLAQQAEEKRIRELEEKKKQQEYDTKLADAKNLGFDFIQEGLLSFVISVRDQLVSLRDAKRYLIHTSPSDDFTVLNVVDDYVIYSTQYNSVESFQVAIVKVKNRFYGEGAPMVASRLKFREVQRFQNVLKSQKEILVFEEIR
ncbi:MAG: hypothetical protein RL368_2095 [Pseudomonadota bacterium]|jgi:hypothetical protein